MVAGGGVASLAVAVILFEGGLSLDLRELRTELVLLGLAALLAALLLAGALGLRAHPEALRPALLALGLVFAALAGGLGWSAGLPPDACATAAITALCAVYWVTEALPIPATSMLPFALLPMVGVLTAKDIASAYGHDLILLLLGGFMLSTALERNGAHRRLALGMLRLIGARS